MAVRHRGYGPLVVELRTPLLARRGRSTARRRGRRGLPHALYAARIAVPPPAPGTAPGISLHRVLQAPRKAPMPRVRRHEGSVAWRVSWGRLEAFVRRG